MYDTILFPTDGSEGADAALDQVRNLAEICGATVHVLYVVDTIHEGVGLGSDPHREQESGMVGDPEGEESGMTGDRSTHDMLRAEMENQGEVIIEAAADRLAGIDKETVVRGGDPHQVIVDYANDNDIDIIVMGTHGRTGLDRYLIGSVTEKVVRLSDAPVLTVRKDES